MKIFEDILNWANIGAAFLTASSSADSYIAKESAIAKTRLLANIGPDGATCHGAKVSSLLVVIDFTDIILVSLAWYRHR